MRHAPAALILLVLLQPSLAREKSAGPDTPEQAAEKVLAANRAGDEAALKALARRAEPAPRLVVEVLRSRGALKAAAAFAREWGSARRRARDLPGARDAWKECLAILEDLGDGRGIAGTALDLGVTLWQLGENLEALDALERARSARLKNPDPFGLAKIHGSLGLVQQSLGEFGAALVSFEKALALFRSLEVPAAVAMTHGNLGIVHMARGDYARALRAHERCLSGFREQKDRRGEAMALGNIGSVHEHLGDHEKALATYQASQRILKEVGDRLGMARNLHNLGVVYQSLGASGKALEAYGRALEAWRTMDYAPGSARTLHQIGSVHEAGGSEDVAARRFEQSLEIFERTGDPVGVAMNLLALARLRPEEAAEMSLRALARLEGVDAGPERARALIGVARGHLEGGELPAALDRAREAVRAASRMFGGLGSEQGARVRSLWDDLFIVGAVAALEAGDEAELAFFLESGRAGSLLDSMGGRNVLREGAVPEHLRREEARVRQKVTHSASALRKAIAGGELTDVRARRAEHRLVEEEFRSVVTRIQREAKWGAAVLYPEPAPLSDVRVGLDGGDRLVLYAFLREDAVALIVSRKSRRVVRLGSAEEVGAACRALVASSPESQPSGPLRRLRDLVVTPLGLDPEATRLLVSPAGALSNVPFCLLCPGSEVAYVPSGTAYGVLRGLDADGGKDVLAVGDPVHGRLPPLPATRKEATSVGDLCLLGKDATEAALIGAVAKRKRWRAVHFACHGLIDPDRPTLSSLALTPDPANDGVLTGLEVFRMGIPADLVALSACESARGRIYRAEGIVGMATAFMMAGVPRVLCSLWNVDDEATRALMVKFYELWNPEEGDGLPAAAALKQAQEFVRSHEKWSHPYYWAAWVLWGLPD